MIASGMGYSRGYDYSVNITGAPVTYGNSDHELAMRCETFSFPSQNIETTQDNIRIGPIRAHAFGVNYGEVSGTFLCDYELSEKRFFEEWQRKIFDPESFKVNYYEDYVATIKVRQFTLRDEAPTSFRDATYAVELVEAFPKTVTQLDVGTANGEFLRVSVAFQYHHWKEI